MSHRNNLQSAQAVHQTLDQALQLHQQGCVEEAMRAYQAILNKQPNHPDALHLMGLAALETGDFVRAETFIRRALQSQPESLYLGSLGTVYLRQNRYDEAIDCYQQAIEKTPTLYEPWFNQGKAYLDTGNFADAARCFQKVVDLKPDWETGHAMLATALSTQGDPLAALKSYEKALENGEGNAALYYNLGNTFLEIKRLEQAAQAYCKAIQLDPKYEKALDAWAFVLSEQGKTQEALKVLQYLFQLRPSHALCVKMALLLPILYQTSQEVQHTRLALTQNLLALLQEDIQLTDPLNDVGKVGFYLAYQGENDRDLQAALGAFYSRSMPLWPYQYSGKNAKPRIGFISRHFAPGHTIGRLTRGLIQHIDREKFDVVAFCIGMIPAGFDDTASTSYVSLPTHNLAQACEKIAAHNLDLLFYSDIGMEATSYFLALNRLAKVQCVTWGHPVTTGVPNVDYFISSKLVEPIEADDHYCETLVRLDTLPSYYEKPEVTHPLKSRQELTGLTDADHLYLCPQSAFKFHPDFDPLLGEILRRDPQGHLVLLKHYAPQIDAQLKARFENTIPDVVSRIHWVDRMPRADFLNLMAVADVMLDPLHFGSGNTCYESFAVGTPVVTLPGPYMRGRVVAGCHQKMGLETGTVDSPEAYIALAVRLGTDPDFRNTLRQRILQSNDALYCDLGAVRELESFFLEAIQQADEVYNTEIDGAEATFEPNVYPPSQAGDS